MRLATLFIADHYPELDRSLADFYAQLIDQAVLADELGYQACFIAEHHFHPYGAVPNPAVVLSAIAQRTRHILLGPAVTILPFRDARTVAEDYALLDQLSNGRVVLGLGSGYLKHEFAGFNRDPAEKRARFDEGAAVLQPLIHGKRVTLAGQYNQLNEVQLNVSGLQRAIPIYFAALSKEAAYHIGRQGVGLMTIPYGTLERFESMKELAEAFERGRRESGLTESPHGLSPHITAFHTYVARTEAEVEANIRGPFELYCRTRLYARPWTYEQILENGLALFGTVDQIAQKLVMLAGLGITTVSTIPNFGALAPNKVKESMRLMSSEVLPRVQAALALAP